MDGGLPFAGSSLAWTVTAWILLGCAAYSFRDQPNEFSMRCENRGTIILLL